MSQTQAACHLLLDSSQATERDDPVAGMAEYYLAARVPEYPFEKCSC